MKRKSSCLASSPPPPFLHHLPPRGVEETHNLQTEEPYNARKKAALTQVSKLFQSQKANKETKEELEHNWPLSPHYKSFTESITHLRRHISQSEILQLLNRFDAVEHRERAALLTLLQEIYNRFPQHRIFIRKSVYNVFREFNSKSESRNNGISELLVFISRIVETGEGELEEEFRVFLVKSLIPLYKSKWLVMFYPYLRNCIYEILIKDRKLACSVLLGIKKFWPKQGSSREYFFLDAAECFFMAAGKAIEFNSSVVELVEKIAFCLSSTCFFVAEKALNLLDPDGGLGFLIKSHFKDIMPVIIPKLEEVTDAHWRPGTRNLGERITLRLIKFDQEKFRECCYAYKRSSKDEDEETLDSNWEFFAREKRWKELEGMGEARMMWSGFSSKLQLPGVLASN